MACLLSVTSLGTAPEANAEMRGQSSLKMKRVFGKHATRLKRRDTGVRIYLPRGPGSVYEDYPYYYSRGYYPRRIGGYVYYPSYYYYPRYKGYRRSLRRPRG
jgi:hypothetical protein